MFLPISFSGVANCNLPECKDDILFSCPCDMQYLSSQTRDWTCAPAVGAQSPNHWTAREFLMTIYFPRVRTVLEVTSPTWCHWAHIKVFGRRCSFWRSKEWIRFLPWSRLQRPHIPWCPAPCIRQPIWDSASIFLQMESDITQDSSLHLHGEICFV